MRDMDRQAVKDRGARRKMRKIDQACAKPRGHKPMREIAS